MEDDNAKEGESSTSAKENNKGPGSENQPEGRSRSESGRHRSEEDNSRIESASSVSSFSAYSRLYLASSGHKGFRLITGPKDSKLREKGIKKQRSNSGRVDKRPHPRHTRRRDLKKVLRRRTRRERAVRNRRRPGHHYASRSASPRCDYCGHRCCRRYEERRYGPRRRRDQKLRPALKAKQTRRERGQHQKLKKILRSEGQQAGSTSLMLSPLCTNRADVPTLDTTEVPLEAPLACEITPEMIYEAMRRLTLWRHDVATMAILEYIKRCYPVCRDIPALCEELTIKLDVAAKVGILKATSVGRWQLLNALEKRHLTTNHVSLFWTIFADTMKPVTKKPGLLTIPDEDIAETQTGGKEEDEADDDDDASVNMNKMKLHYEIT